MFQYPVGVVRSQTNLAALYGLSSFWNTYFANAQLYTDVLGAQTNLMGRLYVRLLQEMSPVSLSGTNVNLQQEVQLETFPVGGPYTLSTNVTSCKYLVDRPVLPRLVLENNIDFTIQKGSIIWANPENVSSYPFALQTGSSGTQIAVWLVDAQLDEGWLYKYYGNLLEVPYQPSSEAYSQFLQGVLYMQVNGPIVDILTAGLQITLGLPLALYDEVVLSTATLEGQYVVITDQTSYSINAGLNLRIAQGTQLSVGQPLFPQAGAVIDWQVKDKWWINLSIPEQIIPNPPLDPICLPGNWADQLVETYLKTHSFLVQLGVSVTQIQEFTNILQNVIPTYTYPWVFSIVSETDTLNITDTISQNLSLGTCQRTPQIDLFTKANYDYTRGCPIFNRYSIPAGVYDRNMSSSSLSQSSSAYTSYFERSTFISDPLTVSYASATLGNRNMATPRLRSSYTPIRGQQMDSVNPWATLIPYFMAPLNYISQYVQPDGFLSTVGFNQLPAPTSYQYLNWYYETTAVPNLAVSSVPSGTQLALFNLIDDIYGVCIVLPSGEEASYLDLLKFGDIQQPLDQMRISATIPLYRGAAANFGNPFFLGKTQGLQMYNDALNTNVSIDRSGSVYLESHT